MPKAVIVSKSTGVTTFAVVWIEILLHRDMACLEEVTTFAVVWIEIIGDIAKKVKAKVTTFAVVWIEIFLNCRYMFGRIMSPPSRWCGLKLRQEGLP